VPLLPGAIFPPAEAALHCRSMASTAGWEWFITSTRFLDEIARVVRISIEVINGNILAEG
jgi:hypothetical protein